MRTAAVMLAMLLVSCKEQPVSDFCQQMDTVGETALVRMFSNEELEHIKLSRKRALLALRRAYDAHCNGVPK